MKSRIQLIKECVSNILMEYDPNRGGPGRAIPILSPKSMGVGGSFWRLSPDEQEKALKRVKITQAEGRWRRKRGGKISADAGKRALEQHHLRGGASFRAQQTPETLPTDTGERVRLHISKPELFTPAAELFRKTTKDRDRRLL